MGMQQATPGLNVTVSRTAQLMVILGLVVGSGCSGPVGGRHAELAHPHTLYDSIRLGAPQYIRTQGQGAKYFDLRTGESYYLSADIIIGWNEAASLVLAEAFHEGLAVASLIGGDRYGYVDCCATPIIPFEYIDARPFSNGRAVVAVDTGADHTAWEWALIDRANRFVIAPGQYDELATSREGRFAFRSGERWGLLDLRGQEVAPPRFQEPPVFYEGLAAVIGAANEWVYIDRMGREALTTPNDTVWAGSFHDGVAWFAVNVPQRPGEPFDNVFNSAGRRYGLMTVAGNVLIEPTYRQVSRFSEGLAAVSVDSEIPYNDTTEPMHSGFEHQAEGKWGYCDTTGRVVIPPMFNRVGRFCEGMARARQEGKWGYIDHCGAWVIRPEYDWASDFQNGVAKVWLDGHVVFVDRHGRVVLKTDLPAVTF